MRVFNRKVHPLLVVGILLLVCAVAWAVAELSGQANKSAADAGVTSANMEMASLETITKPAKNPPNVDWQLERSLRKELEKQDKAYNDIAAKAQEESANGIDSTTAKSLLASAATFNDVSNKYAEVWEKGKCVSRARLAREAGASRLASAEVIAAGANKDKIEALNAQQDKLNAARQDYIKEAVANDEISAEDKAQLKADLTPRAQKILNDTTGLVTQVTNLLTQVQSQIKPSGLSGGLGGLASGISSSPSGGADLLAPVTSLLSLAKGLAGNASSLSSDIAILTK